jgi:hypothetical protein
MNVNAFYVSEPHAAVPEDYKGKNGKDRGQRYGPGVIVFTPGSLDKAGVFTDLGEIVPALAAFILGLVGHLEPAEDLGGEGYIPA